MSKVYLSGPITGAPDYKERFLAAENKIKEKGFTEIINPARIEIECLSWQEYMEIDMTLLDMCDTIIMLEGWERSKGAKIEKEYAEKKSYNVFGSVEEFMKSLKGE